MIKRQTLGSDGVNDLADWLRASGPLGKLPVGDTFHVLSQLNEYGSRFDDGLTFGIPKTTPADLAKSRAIFARMAVV